MSDSWKSPTTIIAIITLLLSICGNVFQYYNFQFDKQKWEVEKQTAINQNNDLRKRLDVFLEKEDLKKGRLEELKAEIDNMTISIENLTKEISAATFIAQMATLTTLNNESSDQEKDDAVARSEAALDRTKELTKSKERLIEHKKEKELEYNRILNQ